MEIFSHKRLLKFTANTFELCGMHADEAKLAAEVLIAADLRGIDSHGVARLSGYVRLQKAGRANFNALHKILHQTPSTATIDADGGLGLNIAPKAMQLAIDKAKNCGTGWVAIQNSNHFGIAGYHAMMALEHDMIGIAMTNASPLVAPTNSKTRMLGTNPICFAIPSKKHPAFVADLATSTAANGKLEIAQRAEKPVPQGWIIDNAGQNTTNPNALKEGGVLLPLGSGATQAGHKGYALSAVVDLLSGVLSGANYGPWVPPFVSFLNPLPNLPGKGIGHFLGAMRIDAFTPKERFYEQIDNWIDAFKNAERIEPDTPILIPGEPEHHCSLKRIEEGIPLNKNVVDDLIKLGSELGIKL